MSSVEALRTATGTSAKRFGFKDRGVIEMGRRADLVLVKGRVDEKLEMLWEGEGIVGIWKAGLKLKNLAHVS
jgi:imidazolonepropionase-like amidohydrolase